MAMYGEGSRKLQDRYNARKVADVIAKATSSATFTDEYQAFIESCSFFFLATAGKDNTDCSFKGGPDSFVKITGPDTLVFPDYDGNRMFKSLGNISENPNVGLLFIKFDAEASARYLRVRVNGKATVHDDHPEKGSFPGAKRMVEVKTEHIYLNCGRYIPEMQLVETSRHIPKAGEEQPVPEWKNKPGLKEALEGSDP